MKFTLTVILIIALAALAGCGQASPAPGFGQGDLVVELDGTPYALHLEIEAVIADFGEGYEYSEVRSCDHDGLDKTFIYAIAQFYTYPQPRGDLVNEIYTDHPSAATSKGVRVGAAKDEVLALYGAGCEDTGYQLIYRLPGGGSLCFDYENGVVTGFYITTRAF